jgi:hypothetical protein
MPARNPEDILKDIEDSEIDDEADRILAMRPEDRRRKLESAGVDIEALRAKADALHARVHRDAEEDKPPDGRGALTTVVPIAARPRPRAPWGITLLAAALGVAALGATVLLPKLLETRDARPVSLDAASSSTASPQPSPHAIRDGARQVCAERRWRECLDSLDAARALDPKGDADEWVQAARRAALQGTAQESGGKPEKK